MRLLPQTRLRPRPHRRATLLLIFILLLSWVAPTPPRLKAATIPLPAPQATLRPPASTKAPKPPLAFVPNAGQAAGDVRFQAHAMGGLIAFRPSEIAFSLPSASAPDAQPAFASANAPSLAASGMRAGTGAALPPASVLHLRFGVPIPHRS